MKESVYYTPLQVAIASLIGGPLAGAWLMKSNYQLFGERSRAYWAMPCGIVVCIVLLVLGTISFKDGAIVLFPFIFLLASAAIFYFLARKNWQKTVAKVNTMETERKSFLLVVSIGLLSLMVTSFLFISIVKIVPDEWQAGDRTVCFTNDNGERKCLTHVIN